jgi:hypothetical protein
MVPKRVWPVTGIALIFTYLHIPNLFHTIRIHTHVKKRRDSVVGIATVWTTDGSKFESQEG